MKSRTNFGMVAVALRATGSREVASCSSGMAPDEPGQQVARATRVAPSRGARRLPSIVALLLAVAHPIHADAPAAPTAPAAPASPSAVPSASFPASRYEVLWTKSPFAVATSETVGEESPDYTLVGIANFDGISYASVMETKPPQEHFLISTNKPTRGMTLKSINHNHDGSETYAVVVKDGQTLTLKLQEPPAVAANNAGAPINNVMPGAMAPQIPMPGGASSYPSVRPFTRFHRAPIHLPPQPQPTTPATGTPPPAPPPPPQ